MAIEKTLITGRIRLLLDNGTTASGQVKTLTVTPSFFDTKLDPSNDDDMQKVYNIGAAAAPVLAKSVYQLQNVATYSLREGS